MYQTYNNLLLLQTWYYLKLDALYRYLFDGTHTYTYPQSISFRVHWIDDLHKMHRCINMILCALSDDAAFVVIFMQSYLIWYHADNASYENKSLLTKWKRDCWFKNFLRLDICKQKLFIIYLFLIDIFLGKSPDWDNPFQKYQKSTTLDWW